MCGIAGWVDFNDDLYFKDDVMKKLSTTLQERGPDAAGQWKSHCCYFVHRRLIVIDPENGKQPMLREANGKRYVITYNGELYNTEEIRKKLQLLGYHFNGHSDTEVLLTSYIAFGEKCLLELNGIYAFAVWDDYEKTLFLARDRAGVKPLFYHVYDNGVIFGSQIKTLLAHPLVSSEIGEEGIASIVFLGPARKGGSGVFKDIDELKPGYCAMFGLDGFKQKQYWSLKAKEHFESIDETAEHVKFLINDSVTRQLVSDVPLCTFLSGGLDSSIISAIAAKQYRQNGEKLTTYSIDYKNNHANFVKSAFQPDEDAPWIVRMKESINSEHHNVIVDTPQLAEALFDSTLARDLPGMADVDSSLLLFCRAVKNNFTVAVSGECADEIFAGYPWYHNEDILYEEGFPWARSTEDRSQLLKQGLLKNFSGEEYVKSAYDETIAQTQYLTSDSKKDRRMREMFMLNFYWFMQTLLDRKDRMSMATGLEVRVPFCDHRIAEYAYNIPWHIKAYKDREKGIVRKAAESLLPYDVVWRKKSPYPKTHNPDYMNYVIGKLSEILQADDCRLTEIFERRELQRLIETGGKSFRNNWYGQLMTAPQVFAYLIQTEYWLRSFNVKLASGISVL